MPRRILIARFPRPHLAPKRELLTVFFAFACARMSAKHKNLVGPQVRRLRYQRGWKQKDLAAKLQILGWDIDRASVSKIESQLVWVGDFEMFYLAEALRVELKQLFPAFDPAVALHDNIAELRRKR